jgi:outer membrane protein TolC
MSASLAPSFQWSILNYGRILSNVQVQDARFQQLVFTYQEIVLQAAREAEDSIFGFLQSQDRAKFTAESADAAQKALEVTNKQYREGAVDYTPVFIFQGTLAQQQDQFAVAQGDVALNLIRLYRALGGGWEMRLQRNGDQQTQQIAAETSSIPSEEVAAPASSVPRK